MSGSPPSFASASGPAPDLNAPRIGAGALSGYAALAAGVVATAVTTPVVVHALGAARFGLWVALVAAVSFTGLLDFGFSQAAARFTGEHRARRDPDTVNRFISATGTAYLVAFALVLLVTGGIGLAFPRFINVAAGDRPLILPGAMLVGLATALGLWMGFFGSLLHAHQRLQLANAVRAGYWLLFTILTIAVALAGWGIVGVAGAMAASAGLSCVALAWLVWRTIPTLRWRRPEAAVFWQSLSYSTFMFMISAGSAVVFETDTIVIAAFKGAAAVTAYAIALRLTRGLTLFLHKLPDVLFPFYAGMRAVGDTKRIRNNYLLTARLELAGAVIVVLGLSFAGRPLIAIWVGPSNLASLSVFGLAIVLVLMEAVVHPGAILAAATGGERRMAIVNNAEATINLGLSIVFVIRFGVAGVIAATLLAQALTNLWYLPRWAMQRLGIAPAAYARATFGRAILPGLCGAVAGLAVGWWWSSTVGAFAAAAAAALTFIVTYLRLGAGSEERSWVRGWLPVGQRAA